MIATYGGGTLSSRSLWQLKPAPNCTSYSRFDIYLMMFSFLSSSIALRRKPWSRPIFFASSVSEIVTQNKSVRLSERCCMLASIMRHVHSEAYDMTMTIEAVKLTSLSRFQAGEKSVQDSSFIEKMRTSLTMLVNRYKQQLIPSTKGITFWWLF